MSLKHLAHDGRPKAIRPHPRRLRPHPRRLRPPNPPPQLLQPRTHRQPRSRALRTMCSSPRDPAYHRRDVHLAAGWGVR